MKILASIFAIAALTVGMNACPVTQAITSQTLSGGTDVLGADTFAAFSLPQTTAVKLETVAVTGQKFTQAWRASSLQHVTNSWEVQTSATNMVALQKDDVLVVQFWARAITGTAQTEFVLELAAPPYDKSITVGIHATASWTLFQLPFKANRDYVIGEAAAHFRLGFDNQTLEFGGVVLKNFAKTKLLSDFKTLGFSYAGREANATWRIAANARIEQIRKSDFKVKVVDANNQPVSGATVHLEMKKHAFKFGTAVSAQVLKDNPTYKAKILELYNHAVLGNDLKWPDWESYSKQNALDALTFFKANGITARGHNLIWPCDTDYCLPTDVVAMFNDPAKLRSRIDAHFQDILGATQGQLVEWDVVNEPSANKRIAIILGEDEMAVWYKRVKQLEPKATLFMNDYGNLGEGTLDVEFKRILTRMLELGAPVEGIGLQSHFGWELPAPEDVYNRLNGFATFGKTMAITEFDVNITDEQLQADYLRDFMTITFSHPGISSFLMWGFWESEHWLPNAALYRKDWSIKPNGQAWLDLVKKAWWTDISISSDLNGQVVTRGFLGDYVITATLGSKTVSLPVTLEKTSGEFRLKLP